MSTWTKEEVPEMIGQWKAAYKAASLGKSYTINNPALVRQDESIILAQLDALNNELVSQVLATSFSVFIAIESPSVTPMMNQGVSDEENDRYAQIEPGRVYYGDPDQKPYIPESNRPDSNFANFVEIILRAMAASRGIQTPPKITPKQITAQCARLLMRPGNYTDFTANCLPEITAGRSGRWL